MLKQINLVNNFINTLGQPFNFSGRTNRHKYWSFVIIANLIGFILLIFDMKIIKAPIFSSAFYLLIFLPLISSCVRRLHDAGLSGWWSLLSFIPVFGTVATLVMYLQASELGNNQYGKYPNPNLYVLTANNENTAIVTGQSNKTIVFCWLLFAISLAVAGYIAAASFSLAEAELFYSFGPNLPVLTEFCLKYFWLWFIFPIFFEVFGILALVKKEYSEKEHRFFKIAIWCSVMIFVIGTALAIIAFYLPLWKIGLVTPPWIAGLRS